MKIHMSSYIKKILDLFGTFVIELRGEVEMKVKYCYIQPRPHHHIYILFSNL